MIRVVAGAASAPQRFALDTLVDLARLVPSADAACVELHVASRGAPVAVADVAGRLVAERADGRLVLDADVLDAVTRIVGAVAEQRTEACDRHERVPSTENAMVAAGIEREPVVNAAARALADAVHAVAGARPLRFIAPWPDGRRWAAAFTHDLDVVSWWPVFTALRGVELAKKGRALDLARVVAAAGASVFGDPVGAALRNVLRTEHAHGVRSSWFVLCGTPTARSFARGDLTYAAAGRAARRALRAVADAGHEIALHGSFSTMDGGASEAEFAAQRAALARITRAAPADGVRQHFLRMRPGATQRAMRAAGFRYDATFGFTDRNGFRLGVADVVRAWDARDERAVADLDLAPLAWMDRALSKYQGVEDPERWIDDALALADRCRAAEGLWVGLWHPNLSAPLGFPGAEAAYERLVRTIVARDPWIAPLEEIVKWRRARRSVRAESADRFTAAGRRGWPIAIEDGQGRNIGTAEPR